MKEDPAPAPWDGDGIGKKPGTSLAGILVGLAAMLIFWVVFVGLMLIQDRTPPAADAANAGERVEPAPTGTEAIHLADAGWRRFVEAADFDARTAAVLDASRVAPMMHDHHIVRGRPWPSMNRRSAAREIRRGSRHVVVFEVEDFGGVRYPVAMEWSGSEFLVDWESLSAYGTIDWSTLIETRPTEPQTLRIYLAMLPGELQPPASVAAGRTFVRMEHRDSPEGAALAIGPDLAPSVLPMIEGRRVPVTAKIAWNAGLSAFELLEAPATGWSGR